MPKCLDGVDWATIMGEVEDQLDHDICWAVVASELIRAVILIERPGTDPNIRFSIQDLVDHTDPVERRNIKASGHYCYTSSINRGMKYVMENGILTEEDRPFSGCPKDIPDRQQSELSYIKDFKRLHTADEALLQLKHQPIGAAVAMFYPEFNEIGENMYRGPVLQNSRLIGLHAVSLVKAGVKNGERYIRVRSSNGENIGFKGYLDVSLDVMFAYVPTPGEETDSLAQKYFAEPSPLLRRFSYPRLFKRAEEEKRRRKSGR
ncbi:Cysteine proteinases superfamily protein [Raphanus sativus]|nr:Cysteine proteinases superfamily protein [Raphanus sativus]